MNTPDPSQPDTSSQGKPIGEFPPALQSPFAEFYHPPRLGIIHLLAWTAATAVLTRFWLLMHTLEGPDSIEMPSVMEVFRQVISCIFSAANGAGVVGACVLLLGKLRRAPGRLQPGHCCTLIETTTFVLILTVWFGHVMIRKLGLQDSQYYLFDSEAWILLGYGGILVIRAVAYLVATVLLRDARRWRVTLGALSAVSLMAGLGWIGGFFHNWLLSVAAIPLWRLIGGGVLLVTVLLDLRRGSRRDWLHWLGVAIIFVDVLVSLAWMVWSVLATRMLN
jgi:hypothetical protein